MAIQNLKCPNCGGELQLDDNLDKGFCMYCGGAIQIKEEIAKIKIEHSGTIEHTGKVEIDDSKKLANSITLADRAFESGNYEECYNYCCTALECDVNNARITFRKGLCAVYMSFTRSNELDQALKTACEIIKNTSNDADNDYYVMFAELFGYITSMYKLNCNRTRGFVYPNLAAANNTFSIIAALTEMCNQCAELISEDMMDTHPTFEADKKICLEQGLELCKQGTSSLKYLAGYQQVKKGDSYVQEEVHEKVKSPFIEMQKSYLAKFKNDINNLPTIRKALMGYNSEIENLQKDIDAFTSKMEEYFKANPEIEKEYKQSALPFIILTGVAFTLVGVVGVALVDAVSETIFGLIMSLLSFGFAGLAVLTIIRMVKYSKNRKRIMNELPSELICLKNVHDQSQIKLKSVKQKKADFEKKNVK